MGAHPCEVAPPRRGGGGRRPHAAPARPPHTQSGLNDICTLGRTPGRRIRPPAAARGAASGVAARQSHASRPSGARPGPGRGVAVQPPPDAQLRIVGKPRPRRAGAGAAGGDAGEGGEARRRASGVVGMQLTPAQVARHRPRPNPHPYTPPLAPPSTRTDGRNSGMVKPGVDREPLRSPPRRASCAAVRRAAAAAPEKWVTGPGWVSLEVAPWREGPRPAGLSAAPRLTASPRVDSDARARARPAGVSMVCMLAGGWWWGQAGIAGRPGPDEAGSVALSLGVALLGFWASGVAGSGRSVVGGFGAGDELRGKGGLRRGGWVRRRRGHPPLQAAPTRLPVHLVRPGGPRGVCARVEAGAAWPPARFPAGRRSGRA